MRRCMKNARRSEAGVIQRAGGLSATYDSRTSCKTQLLVGPRFARQIKRVSTLGERPLAELLIEIARSTCQPALIADYVGADKFPPMPLGGVR